MKYILFLGHSYGYKALLLFIELKIDILKVVIEAEFEHETEKYSELIRTACTKNSICFTEDLSKSSLLTLQEKCTADIIFVLGYRRLIPKSVFEKVENAMAMHYSLLPQYRGFAPVNWAMINGEKQVGVSLFYLADEADSGDIIAQESVEIESKDDINTLMEKCDDIALEIIKSSVEKFENGVFPRFKQNHDEATYTCARAPEDGKIEWENDCESIYNLVRATTLPYPCAFTYFDEKRLRIIDCEKYETGIYVGRIAGKIIKIIKGVGVVVLAGKGAILLKNVMDDNNAIYTADYFCKSVRKKFY